MAPSPIMPRYHVGPMASTRRAISKKGFPRTRSFPVLTAPLDYLRDSPGKDIRSGLTDAFNEFLCVPEDKVVTIKRIIDLLHNASLLIDDIQDDSKLRRGVPVAHSIFGIAQTINSANLAYFLAQQELKKLSNPDAFAIYTDELINLHRGQGMELHWRESLHCPTEEEYMRMVQNKTGGLFRLAIRLLQGESRSDRDYVPLVDTLGTLFQIRDDYQNLQSDVYSKNKGFCEDISEGKFSYPVIHSIRARPGDLRLLNILKQRSEDLMVKQYAVSYINSTGSFEFCRGKIDCLAQWANLQLAALEEAEGAGRGDKLRAVLRLLDMKASGKQADVAS
uniref:Geranylgeranyl pyrophosphate synthase idtG n=1 Tax=Claviceps paspali TaxID=40601 RepID=IDTG_CLAPA|nr:RecName: Full=Geranylgeranyl pyrophosphate synthase idtG; Short=GGPP synthase; Short=GGPPSase; AltName: Full=(2E,6E)-farnesyl diphosphate synthase; AltName: Full=Dimethylallyltranstransferase; AltName: Full=Farnesyl diphosphate synthase; AltName: Full=Farnesyltranstransferase; AltName: Full=Geranylgeranyl diphosphate synthase; AltName: Full=Geranyltranstransferase; AltName: Full=Indole-diterpene biosynthesis cluster protein G [Claviceps paspali]AFO85420.1 geranylgeranyl diphosphate synthase [Cl